MLGAQSSFLQVFLVKGLTEARPIYMRLPSGSGQEHCQAVFAYDDSCHDRITNAEAFARVSRALETPPADPALFALLLCYQLNLARQVKQMSVAQSAYEQLNRLNHLSLPPELRVRMAIACSGFLRRQHRPHLALPILSEAARLPLPVGSRFWCKIRCMRSQVAIHDLQYELAENDLKELRPYAQNLNDPDLFDVRWASYCLQAGQFDLGLQHLDQARIVSPANRPWAIILRLVLLLHAGRIAEGVVGLEEAERLGTAGSAWDPAYVRTLAALLQGQLPQARAHALQVLAHMEAGRGYECNRLLHLLVHVDLAASQPDSARRMLMLMDPDGTRPDVAMEWARLLLLERNEEEAARHFARTLRADSPRAFQAVMRFASEVSCSQVERLRYLAERSVRERAAAPPVAAGAAGSGFVGQSPAACEVRANIERFAPVETSVLITGETGTGKEVVARQLHALSGRASQPFVAVNCGGVSDSLIESELFGHVQGAFTGAVRDHDGLFVAAGGGTIFLDEINAMSPHLQNSLIRVLENREIRPVGSSAVRRVRARVVAACNQPLEAAVRQGRFRADLYYRLARLHIHIPPLRQRLEDIEPLARHFLNQLGGFGFRLTEALCGALRRHDWPGNVRELHNELERIVLLSGTAERLGSELFETRIPWPDQASVAKETPALPSEAHLPPAPVHPLLASVTSPVSLPSPDVDPSHTLSRRRRVRTLFDEYGKLTRVELVRMIGCSARTATLDLRALEEEGLIQRVETSANLRTSYFIKIARPQPAAN